MFQQQNTSKMKKSTLILLALAFSLTAFSQNRKAEKKLVGTWNLVEILNIDELVEQNVQIKEQLINKEIKEIEEILNDTTIDDFYLEQNLELQLEEYDEIKKNLNSETGKEQIRNEINEGSSGVGYVFKADNTYKALHDNSYGTWEIKNEGTVLQITTFSIETDLQIHTLSSKKLIVTELHNGGEAEMEVKMEFEKMKK